MSISADDILSVTRSVMKEWTKQRKAEEKNARARSSRQYIYSGRVDFTEVADAILPGAYQHASGNGAYTVSKRQLYYACREAFRTRTTRPLQYSYFANTLLVQYLNRHPETSSWKVTADPRGTLVIPNCGHDERIPCGTIQIDEHLRRAGFRHELADVRPRIRTHWPSVAAGQRYQAVLYIEKEGFGPLLEEARIGERFDLAILSCKGQSVVAARRFVDEVCAVGTGVPLFVVHDFDKAGFEISQRLTSVSDWAEDNDRVTYQFRNNIDVTDLGLRLADVEKYQLQDERVKFDGHFASDSIATAAEQAFLKSGRRVELNAFTSPQFIEWIPTKLKDAGLKERLIPDDATIESAYRRAIVVARLNHEIEKTIKAATEEAKNVKVPKSLRKQLKKFMNEEPLSWDRALYAMTKLDLFGDDQKDFDADDDGRE